MNDVAIEVVGQVVEVMWQCILCGNVYMEFVPHCNPCGGEILCITKGGSGTTSGDRGHLKRGNKKRTMLVGGGGNIW
jgi:hypothetical protein